MNYVGIILALLSLASKLFDWFQERKWIAEGADREIAKASVEILRKTNYAKTTLKEFAAKSDSELDDLLRSFEPGEPGKRDR